ncbi:hypothetical protein PF005_g5106 [Phytophthora fragariae]|uniref:DUF4203 domain-containing protein n=1 Tax=Phytophthora fragariae TaxID=53985 RepID=A0A6A4DXM4_9STRA|nr:hypothetical protein PF003_g40699 [Phytophthora fragariae]KAE8944513.1 hypothetical protein PF009_g5805 [Phytophthora fragariae]KAE9025170.1 hypothetical protein PF011_g3143 [Phytophthora fragariae]KAE9145413.1 hypothetical protein PF006_g9724 [Phytophthora fragariae]KAE9226462.1 hypothetical protein PF005_g5106 [Phytophthora fragariae]
MLYSASIFLAGAIYSPSSSTQRVILVMLAVVQGVSGGYLAIKLVNPVPITTTVIVGATICA